MNPKLKKLILNIVQNVFAFGFGGTAISDGIDMFAHKENESNNASTGMAPTLLICSGSIVIFLSILHTIRNYTNQNNTNTLSTNTHTHFNNQADTINIPINSSNSSDNKAATQPLLPKSSIV
jgi:hypothetical protein